VARAPPRRKAALRSLIDRLEHGLFGLPRPDLVLYLDMPDALAQRRVLRKAPRAYTRKQLDAHEADRAHLRAALAEYRRQARASPGWARIRTVGPRGEERTREAIHADVLAALEDAGLLPR
jgi:dTMP kinase